MQFLADGGGLFYALQNSTLPGKVVLGALFLASVLSWTVMITKFRMLSRSRERRMDFLDAFRADRQPLSLFQSGARFSGAPVFTVYQAGCRELSFQMLGSAEVDETFAARLETAPKISPAQMRMVQTAMERCIGESAKLCVITPLQAEAVTVDLDAACGLPPRDFTYVPDLFRCGQVVQQLQSGNIPPQACQPEALMTARRCLVVAVRLGSISQAEANIFNESLNVACRVLPG